MKPETLPAHVAKTYDAGLTDSEVIDLGINSNDYLTRRLARVASDLEREREHQQALDRIADNYGLSDPQELEPALAEYWRWQNIPDDFGLEYAEVRAMLELLGPEITMDCDALEKFLIDHEAMFETLAFHGLLDEAFERGEE